MSFMLVINAGVEPAEQGNSAYWKRKKPSIICIELFLFVSKPESVSQIRNDKLGSIP
jgi:hypothetical protein